MDPVPRAENTEVAALRWRDLALRDNDLLRVCEAFRAGPGAWLLDSAGPSSQLARYSFAGGDPYLVARAFGKRIEIQCRRAVRDSLCTGPGEEKQGVFDWLRGQLPVFDVEESQIPVPFPFVGGAVGYWGYELASEIEDLEFHGADDLGLPDATILFVDQLVALDHASGRFFAIALGFGSDFHRAGARAEGVLENLLDTLAPLESPSDRSRDERDLPLLGLDRNSLLDTPMPPDLPGSFDAKGYRDRVCKLKSEIAAGNVYEANLTRRLERSFSGDVFALYRALRRASPAPFASFMELPEVAILSSSPERFLRLTQHGEVESRPIKGTRPRGLSAQEDSRLAADLAASEKDRAENLMIVDLVRNDLGRVCEIGSIRVPELMVVEAYASVFQLVSAVSGKLAAGRDRMDLFRAAFPPGSMTGAPKIAAMKLLDELEPVRRGVYSGALGYLDVRGGMDLSVVIRTLLVHKDRVHVHAGGAVVADSDPQTEYEESLHKARAMWAAVEAADGCGSRRSLVGTPDVEPQPGDGEAALGLPGCPPGSAQGYRETR
ncbi:MAG: aminodeoxychorismate synthase component I [Myxococcota bacterium]|nr:aminodeoxychorismate synthase component I [Myxococcota bacterium]